MFRRIPPFAMTDVRPSARVPRPSYAALMRPALALPSLLACAALSACGARTGLLVEGTEAGADTSLEVALDAPADVADVEAEAETLGCKPGTIPLDRA